MTGYFVLRFFHLVSTAVWTGGLIVLAFLVLALRKEGAERPLLQACARQFARVSWTAMAIAVATGLLQVMVMEIPWTYGPLHIKITLVVVAIILAAVHQFTAAKASPAKRGILQGLILLVSLGIFAAATAL